MNTKKLCRLALLTTIALTIFMVEAQLPTLAPIPGMKLGLANIVTIYAIYTYTPLEALLVLLCRILLGSIFSGQMVSFLYSLCGGLLCFAVSVLLRRFVPVKQLWAVSIVGAMCHNLGQILAATVLMQTVTVFYYLPPLLLCSLVTGAFTGLCAQFLKGRLEKLNRRGS